MIVTLHRVKNYGSVLQTYASMRTLEKMDIDAKVLDYVPERLEDETARKLLTSTSVNASGKIKQLIHKAVVAPSYKRQKKTFDSFLEKYVRLTRRYSREEIESAPPKADLWCTGSDQVFNTEINGGIDGPYYLDFVPDEDRKIAFSASFGMADVSEEAKEETARLLKRYDALSFREQTGVDICKGLGIDGAVNVLDPALCLKKSEWELLMQDIPKAKEKYILVYELNGESDIGHAAKALSEKTGLKVKRVSYYWHHFAKYGKLVFCPGVEQFLSLVRDAQYIVTDSFHATALSILFERQFYSVLPPKFNSRVTDILKLFALENRIVRDGQFAEKEIDYSAVTAKLDEEREKTLAFLEKAVNRKIRKVPQKVYMAYANDKEMRRASSSGGAFGVIAEDFIAKGGVVYGCAFDDKMKARHIRVDSYEELERLRGSKYVISDLTGVFKMVEDDLSAGRRVLFSGTPCNISGLYGAVGKHENLMTVELLCHGVPEQELFRQYLSSLGDVSDYSFRDKTLGWGGAISYNVVNNKTKKHIVVPSKLDSYYDMFYHGYTVRDACIKCRFARPERLGDIVLGDFWGAEKAFPDADIGSGVSLIMLNSEKGEKYEKTIREKMSVYETNLLTASQHNRSLVTGALDSQKRKRIRKHMKNGFSSAVNAYKHTLSVRERASRIKTRLKYSISSRKRNGGHNAA